MKDFKKNIPWWFKIITKLVIENLPIDYRLWKKLSLIEHGAMENPTYAYGVFLQNFEQFKRYCQQNHDFAQPDSDRGFVSLEMGPGDSLFSALISKAFGGSASYLIDVGDFAARDIQKYQDMVDFLAQKGLPTLDIQHLKSLEEVLSAYSAQYLTSGLSSLRTIPDHSVDLIWSNGVLELVRRRDFLDTLRELRRIIKDDGICSHLIPLADSLGGLNSLRFPESIWEADFMAKSSFYVNRLSYSQMLNLFKQAGFDVEVIKINYWDKPPIAKSKLAKEFQNIPDEELNILNFSVILKPA